jgi:hypothetical protein
MFIHLAKRIAMPGEAVVSTCGWNVVDGYVSAGCADGLVKVLKLELPECMHNELILIHEISIDRFQ